MHPFCFSIKIVSRPSQLRVFSGELAGNLQESSQETGAFSRLDSPAISIKDHWPC
ncbi:hypothetical protein KSP40_PGU005304 [Platanthera guangdongensis]|uniref:Uncharacterized protein n=1 Tax=Platanthera guangdongensis TaxID=2320717 RepID=A0ABR2LSP6_9ASPA